MNNARRIELSQREQLTLIVTCALAGAPHLMHLAHWISLFFIAVLGLRLLALRHPALLPGRLPLFLLTVGGLANVLGQYPILLGKQAGVALLTSMLALKLLEMRRRRDVYVLVFLGYFTLATQFLFQQEILLVGYVFLVLVGLTAILVDANRAVPAAQSTAAWARALSLLVQALPIALVLFFFFPRFESPLWDLGLEEQRAVTGIGDSISPGSISRLSRSREIAFRVDFEQQTMPPPAQRYWRGPVFWKSDGNTWREGESSSDPPAALAAASDPLEYSVTLEPAPGNWLFVLDIPRQIPPRSRLSGDFQLLSDEPVKRRKRYRASSSLDYRTGPPGAGELSRGLQLPDNITPRMRELVAQWQQNGASPAKVAESALRHFRQQPFYYTLYPPLAEQNPADQFLFETRAGFCEHYATSFTLLMRIAGIPARVVAGYQGGERNPLGDYLILRQSDAHAWSEVWLEERGWVRVDPTAAVAPERIEQPLDLDQISGRIGAPVLFGRPDSNLIRTVVRHLSWGMDTINASWHRWVLGYSKDRQSWLMRFLGIGFLQGTRLALGMVGATGITVLALFLVIAYRSREKQDPVQAAYKRFCRRLERRGMARRDHEGPRDYARRVVGRWPELGQRVDPIVRLYIGIRYGRLDNRENRRRLARLVRAFRP